MALSAARSLTHGRRAGAPLPHIPELEDLETGFFHFRFRQSETTVIAGQPNAGKSLFALWLCVKFDVPTLYFSADSSSYTASTRLAAATTGETTENVGKALREGGAGYWQDVLDKSQVRFCFDPNPTHTTIAEELDAYVEEFDEFPRVIVVDNLMDVIGGGASETESYKDVLSGLKKINRETEASILVLHHMSETGTSPLWPAPRASVMGKANQTPENVISIAMGENDTFLLSVVKHRNGKADAQAKNVVQLRAFPDRCQFGKFEPLEQKAATETWTPTRWGD